MRRLAATVLLSISLVMAGCASRSGSDTAHEAVQVVAEVLELRHEQSRDAGLYRPYFVDPDMAALLASAAETTVPPIPLWETPYVSAETSATADVIVVWIPDDDHPDWSKATLFALESTDGVWRIGDAVELSGDLPEPLETVGN